MILKIKCFYKLPLKLRTNYSARPKYLLGICQQNNQIILFTGFNLLAYSTY